MVLTEFSDLEISDNTLARSLSGLERRAKNSDVEGSIPLRLDSTIFQP